MTTYLRLDQWFVLLLISALLLAPLKTIEVASRQLTLREIPLSNVPKIQVGAMPQLTASAGAVIDDQTGQVIYAFNDNQSMYPASTVKLMTAWVVNQKLPPSQIVEIDVPAGPTDTQIRFPLGKRLRVDSLMKALLIMSSNQAANQLAKAYPGGETQLIADMNQQAALLGMKNTRFANPVGFDDQAQTTTAWDLSLLVREFSQNEYLTSISVMPRAIITDEDKTWSDQVFTTNKLLLDAHQIIAGKTGTTDQAGEVLVVRMMIKNHPVTSVVMFSQDRWSDTKKIINWLETGVEWTKPDWQ